MHVTDIILVETYEEKMKDNVSHGNEKFIQLQNMCP